MAATEVNWYLTHPSTLTILSKLIHLLSPFSLTIAKRWSITQHRSKFRNRIITTSRSKTRKSYSPAKARKLRRSRSTQSSNHRATSNCRSKTCVKSQLHHRVTTSMKEKTIYPSSISLLLTYSALSSSLSARIPRVYRHMSWERRYISTKALKSSRMLTTRTSINHSVQMKTNETLISCRIQAIVTHLSGLDSSDTRDSSRQSNSSNQIQIEQAASAKHQISQTVRLSRKLTSSTQKKCQ